MLSLLPERDMVQNYNKEFRYHASPLRKNEREANISQYMNKKKLMNE